MDNCPRGGVVADDAYLAMLDDRMAALRVPLAGGIELTRRCNLACRHCYGLAGDAAREPGTDKWLSVLDEITEAGCLYLLLTGGEPLLRDDFCAIYTRARENGLVVTLFTNGTLVDDGVAELLADMPPHVVEISLYGASEATCREVCRRPGVFGATLRGLEKLLSRRIRVRLKTVLMTLNRHEIDAMAQLAAKYGVEFRLDAAVIPRLDGGREPLTLRVSPEEAVRAELADSRRLEQWRELLCKVQGPPALSAMYNCGAGCTEFYINAEATVSPCLMVPDPCYSLLDRDFKSGWQDVIPAVRDLQAAPDFACNRCEMVMACDFCPAFFRLEQGSENAVSEHVCRTARLRYETILGKDGRRINE
ncbi:MAG: radical SAM/SPASM domain-containing protein [Desulfatibacillaceae bacterium]